MFLGVLIHSSKASSDLKGGGGGGEGQVGNGQQLRMYKVLKQ